MPESLLIKCLKKECLTQVFPCEFCKISTFLQNTSGRLLLNIESVFRRIKNSILILMKFCIFKTIPLHNINTIHACLHINILIYIYIILQGRSVSHRVSSVLSWKIFRWDLHLTFLDLL